MDPRLVGGVVVIGFVHGVLPDHGWPIAAAYALDRSRTGLYGTVAGVILGVGHLVSSVALVAAYYWFSRFASFAEGPWLGYAAGVVLVLLGIYEYRHGSHGGRHDHGRGGTHRRDHGREKTHRHDHGHERDHDRPQLRERGHGNGPHYRDQGHGNPGYGHDLDHGHRRAHDQGHGHDHPGHGHPGHGHEHGPRDHGHHARTAAGENPDRGDSGRLRDRLFGSGGHRHLTGEHAERGLLALGTTALVLGFAHEEPVQILAICVGTASCLELMVVYSLAVVVAILAPTLGLIAGYERHRETVEAYTPYLPVLTAAVLVGMGLGFLLGVL